MPFTYLLLSYPAMDFRKGAHLHLGTAPKDSAGFKPTGTKKGYLITSQLEKADQEYGESAPLTCY